MTARTFKGVEAAILTVVRENGAEAINPRDKRLFDDHPRARAFRK
jgi:hypothetical protein